MNAFMAFPAGVMVAGAFIVLVGTVIIHVVFAHAVELDAKTLSATVLTGGRIWALATLVGGVFVAGLYWGIHHSTLFENQER